MATAYTRTADLYSAPCPPVIASAAPERDDVRAVASLLGAGLEPSELPRGCTPSWMLAGTGPGGTSFGAVQGLAAGPGGALPHSGGIRGRPGLILLSVRAGRLRAHRRVLLLAAGR